MRVGIAREKCDLKKHHARVPDLRGSAQKRQNHFGKHGLDKEKQEGVQEKGAGK